MIVEQRGAWGGTGLAWALIALGLSAILFGIDRLPLLDPDEGRNAGVAREMRDVGEWIVPRLHGAPYLDKPVLCFDAIAFCYSLFGRSEGTSRLPSVVFAALAAAAAFLLGARLLGRRRALAGIAVLATAPLFVGFARTVIFDMALTFFVAVSLLLAEEGRRGKAWGYPLAWVATALAVLTKGPIGLLLPMLGTVALSLGQGKPYGLRRYFHPANIALFFAAALPWVIAVEARNPGFLRYAFLTETFERLTRPTFQRTGPIYYYLPVLVLGLFPWSLAALGSLPRWLRSLGALARPSGERGLLFAASAIVLFFSFSSSKLGGYVLPALPPIALLLGAEASRERRGRAAWIWTPGAALLLLGLFLCVGPWRELVAESLRQPPHLAEAADTLLLRIGVISLAVAAATIWCGLAKRATLGFLVLGAWLPAVVFAGFGPALRYAEESSSRGIAAEILRLGGEKPRAAALRCFPVGLEYYLNDPVPLVTETGAELTSTYIARNFESLRARPETRLWSGADLESRLGGKEIDIIVARGNITSIDGFLPAGRFGAYALWRRADGPP